MNFLLRLLRSARKPLPFILILLPLAYVCGSYFTNYASIFRAVGMSGLGLFLLPALPIVVSSIILAFRDLSIVNNDPRYLVRLFFVTLGACLLAGVLGIGGSVLWSAGMLDDTSRAGLGRLLETQSTVISIYIRGTPPLTEKIDTFASYVDLLIPSNLMKHLTNGETLKIIVASSAFGVALSKTPKKFSLMTIHLLRAVNSISTKLLDLFLIFSPIVIFCLIASAASSITYSTASALVGLIVSVTSSSILLALIAHVVFIFASRSSFAYRYPNAQEFQPISSSSPRTYVPEIFIMGLTTSSSLALFSSVRRLLVEVSLKHSQIDTSLVMTLLLARAGNILYNGAVIIFALNLFNVAITFGTLLTVLLLSILTGFAAAGLSGVAAITVIILALDAINIPSGPILVLAMTIDPIFVMIRAATTGVVSFSGSFLACSTSRYDCEPALVAVGESS